MRVKQELCRNELEQLSFNFQHILAGGDAGSVGDAKNVCVYCHRYLPECGIKHHVRGLAAHARQGLKCLSIIWYLRVVFFDKYAAGLDDVLGLTVKEADGLDVLLQSIDT